MATIGNLVMEIAVDTSELVRALKNAEAAIANLSKAKATLRAKPVTQENRAARRARKKGK